MRIKTLIFYWLPTLIWMATIFFFSTRHHFGITEQSTTDFFIFKLLHMLEYAGLYFLLMRSIYFSHNNKQQSYKMAFIIAVLYAVTDEIHQTFVPTREGRVRDVVIDSIGITCAYLLVKKYWTFVKKFL